MVVILSLWLTEAIGGDAQPSPVGYGRQAGISWNRLFEKILCFNKQLGAA